MSACHTDLGIPNEREAGYYSRPWLWQNITAHAGAPPRILRPPSPKRFLSNSHLYDSPADQPPGRAGITQFHSDDDPFIPVAEAQHVACSLALGPRFHLLSGCSHFFSKEDAEPILQAIKDAMA